MNPVLDPDYKVTCVPYYRLSPMPVALMTEMENLAAVAGKTVDQVVAIILTMAWPELSAQIKWELVEDADRLQDEMAAKLEIPKP